VVVLPFRMCPAMSPIFIKGRLLPPFPDLRSFLSLPRFLFSRSRSCFQSSVLTILASALRQLKRFFSFFGSRSSLPFQDVVACSVHRSSPLFAPAALHSSLGFSILVSRLFFFFPLLLPSLGAGSSFYSFSF